MGCRPGSRDVINTSARGKPGKVSKYIRHLVITLKDVKYLQGIEVNKAEGA